MALELALLNYSALWSTKQAKTLLKSLIVLGLIDSDLEISFFTRFRSTIAILTTSSFSKECKNLAKVLWFIMWDWQTSIWDSIVPRPKSKKKKEPSVHNLIQTKNSPSVLTELVADVEFVNEQKFCLWTHKNVQR